jgi:hypothetical protein
MTARLAGTSSAERTLDQRDLAAMRPQAAPRTRKPRSAPVLREVTSGIVCFCGERFGEHQALEFMLHLRAEVGGVLSWANHQKDRIRINSKKQYESQMADPAKHEHLKRRRRENAQRFRERHREEINERVRVKRVEDPEWAERERARKRNSRRPSRAKRTVVP